MMVRALGTMILCKPRQLKHLFLNPLLRCFLNKSSFSDVICKVSSQRPAIQSFHRTERFLLGDLLCVHSVRYLHTADNAVDPAKNTGTNTAANSSSDIKTKRKKLKGKRAVVKWLKFLRWKKKKDYSRMTAEEKILFKLRKARKKEERLVESLKKIEPKEESETTHDPEILTPEEHFYFLKMGKKCKNYVPVGRRGIYQGVILNMHLHWKKHQTLQVIVKTFTPDEVKEMAVELARLTGGIVLDILDGNTIIMYRGKNYSQPPTEIMSPRITLPRKKALDKSKYRDGLRAVRRYIPRLEQELELLHAKADSGTENPAETQLGDVDNVEAGNLSSMKLEASKKLREFVDGNYEFNEDDDALTDSDMCSDSEALSDIFETDRETESEKEERPLYLDAFEKFPSQESGVAEDFEDQLRRISADSRKAKTTDKDMKREFDEVDRMVLRAASLLKKKKGWS